MKSVIRLGALLGACLIAVACAGGADSASGAVERYLTAVVSKDRDAAVTAACAAWEESANLEVDSFAAVDPKLAGMACTLTGSEGSTSLVSCTGAIQVTYNNELQELSLENRTYLAVEENGEWRMCGYK